MSGLLLDTHIWLWTAISPERLSSDILSQLEDLRSSLYLSAASSWEMAIKYRLGKLPLPEPPSLFIPPRLVRDQIQPLEVSHRHALEVAALPDHHSDPFDRLLVAQARLEGLTLVTADQRIQAYDVRVLMA